MIELLVVDSARPALIDDDLAALARYRWRISSKGFVFRYGDKRVKLSHAIAGAPPEGFGVIHRNGDRMDYRRSNLAIESAEHYRKRPRAKRRRGSPGQGDLFSLNAL